MTCSLTPDAPLARYISRKARDEDLDSLVTLFNGFYESKLFHILYPEIKDASALSATHRSVLKHWLHSPVRRLEVIVKQDDGEVVAFCSWALDDSLDVPYKEKYYRGPGADLEVIDQFLADIEHYDELLEMFGDFICKYRSSHIQQTGERLMTATYVDIDWIIVSEKHRGKGLLALMLAWGWRYSVKMKRYILLDSIEGELLPIPTTFDTQLNGLDEVLETTMLWEKLGCLDFTGAKDQWSLNSLAKEATDEPAAKDLGIIQHAAGKAGTDQAVVSTVRDIS